MNCRICGNLLSNQIIDLGHCPPSNSYVIPSDSAKPEIHYPLKIFICSECWLAQTLDFVAPTELFHPDYAYMSSVSESWLLHSEELVNYLIQRFSISSENRVIELASNDGYLLQYFKEKKIDCLGIEPTSVAADISRSKGIETIVEFFTEELAERLVLERGNYDLVIANNVLAHVPDINDFVKGIAKVLTHNGIAVFEFPCLKKLIENNQFDTIYHEHYSYLSLTSAKYLMEKNGLDIFDIMDLRTHGGSLRIFCKLKECRKHEIHRQVMLRYDEESDLRTERYYKTFGERARSTKYEFISYLLKLKRENISVCGYGAAAKGNTLLNFAGIKSDLLPFIVDKNPEKEGMLTPGSHIPIVSIEYLEEKKPKVIVILPWNLTNEITKQLSFVRSWGGRFVVFIPSLTEVAA